MIVSRLFAKDNNFTRLFPYKVTWLLLLLSLLYLTKETLHLLVRQIESGFHLLIGETKIPAEL